MATVPPVGARYPVIMFIVVDLPAPLGPQQAVNTAVLHSEADIIDRGVFSVTLGQMLDFDQWMHSPFSWGPPAAGQAYP